MSDNYQRNQRSAFIQDSLNHQLKNSHYTFLCYPFAPANSTVSKVPSYLRNLRSAPLKNSPSHHHFNADTTDFLIEHLIPVPSIRDAFGSIEDSQFHHLEIKHCTVQLRSNQPFSSVSVQLSSIVSI